MSVVLSCAGGVCVGACLCVCGHDIVVALIGGKTTPVLMPRFSPPAQGGWAKKCLTRCVPVLLLTALAAAFQPHGGSEGIPLILLSCALGVLISVAVPNLVLGVLVSLLMAGVLMSVTYMQELHDSDSEGTQYDDATIPQLAGDVAARSASNFLGPKVALDTMSIVLPCAFEGEFAVKTVRAIWENTIHSRVHEIIVVDDGSNPPLRNEFPEEMLKGGPGIPPVNLIRHERTLGLIGAKKHGGDSATGDVIVFFDCHVSPRKGWEEAVLRQMRRAGDHRTVAVPTITSLDPDTWKEINNGAMGKSCYILWNADFTWLPNPGRDVPLMSGGLLAISRKWWEETGGYDEHMVAWGGENIDQSLRVWLCGGRIELADGAFVAHMWRDPENPKTALRYPIPTKDVMRNKARAVNAWFDDFTKKIYTYPEYQQFVSGREGLGDMSNFDKLKSNLKCAPFASYLRRFKDVYMDSGLIPAEVFQLRETSTGRCLERVPHSTTKTGTHDVVLAPCSGTKGPASEVQLWHFGIKDRRRNKCCSGIMNWNYLSCLDAQSVGGKLRSFDCEIQGMSRNQQFTVQPDDKQLSWRSGEGCIAPAPDKFADAALSATRCSTRVQADSGTQLVHSGASSAPQKFRLVASISGQDAPVCGTVGAVPQGAESITGLQLQFMKCDPEETQQVFTATPMHGGFQIKVSNDHDCFDSAGGNNLLVYPCYEEHIHNMNQVWYFSNDELTWKPEAQGYSFCIDVRPVGDKKHTLAKFSLHTCAWKRGQRIQRKDIRQDGTFLLHDLDSDKCIGSARETNSNRLELVACDADERWSELKEQNMVRHVRTSACLEELRGGAVGLTHCLGVKRPRKTQKFDIVDDPGWLRRKLDWGDNGRRIDREMCLDLEPEAPTNLNVQRCSVTVHRGIHWERIGAFVPLERELWERHSGEGAIGY